MLPVWAIAVLTLAACGSGETGHGDTGGEPLIGPWGVDLESMSTGTDPGDNFNRYVNGHWLDTAVIGEDESRIGSRNSMRERNNARIRDLVTGFAAAAEGAPLTPVERDIGDLYASFVDVDTRNARGIEPVLADVERIRSIDGPESLAREFGRFMETGGASPFTGFIETDFNQPDRRVFFMDVGGLGMYAPGSYLDAAPARAEHRSAYRALIADFLRRLDFADAERLADEVLALEIRIARQQPTAQQRRDFESSVHPYTIEEVQSQFPGFEWPTWFGTLGIADYPHLIVRFPDSVAGLVGVIGTTPMETWRAYLAFHVLNGNVNYLAEDVKTARHELFATVVYGQGQPRAVDEEALRFVQSVYSFEIGRAFVERYFSAAAKAEVEQMFERIRQALRRRLEQSDWMDESTRAEAFEKLSNIRAKIAYPDEWREPPDIEVDRNALMANVRNARQARWSRSVDLLGTPPDPAIWGMAPQSAGAGFHPALNEITIPAGNLQPPFFDEFADDAVNYGAIGGVIGHELLHAFDDIGRHFDAGGAMRDWWSETAATEFERRSQVLVEQYGAYEVLPGRRVDGVLTLGENIADVFGLSIAREAWRLSLEGREPPTLHGFTGEQRFFMGWAQMRRAKDREALTLQLLETDSHSPAELRINGVVRNIDAWYDAFDVRPDDDLYLAPDERARIW